MADLVTSQIIFDGLKKTVMSFSSVSDGTGESAVTKVDVSTLIGAPASVKIDKILFCTSGMAVMVIWDADTDVTGAVLAGDGTLFDFTGFGGLQNNAGAGKTGDILFTTVGHSSGDTYFIVLELSKS
jgi:hypothetical protein